MMDKEEILRVHALLAKSALSTDCKIGNRRYKKGDKADLRELQKVNRFALNSVVKAYSRGVQKQYERA